jgi:cell division inhibitor SulA
MVAKGRGMFRTSKTSGVLLTARLERARQSGYADGGREAKSMLFALRKGVEQSQVIGWVNTVIEEGRADLLTQRAIDREIDAWDMIMFLVMISASQPSRR